MAESSDLAQTLIALEESRRDGWLNRDPQALRDVPVALADHAL
ncbi:MAG TPA: hypothetical protein VIK02_07960 [Candidatus Anoxymicrobiaceae bacterium]